jgi:acetyl-CoA acetyltransferase
MTNNSSWVSPIPAGGKFGLATLCVGVGMGVALALQRL